MIIPIKCFTCGNVLADKYLYFIQEVRKKKIKDGLDTEEVVYLSDDKVHKTPEGNILDHLKLNKICCRRHMLTHVDIE